MTLWTVALGGALGLGMNVAAVAQGAPAQQQMNNAPAQSQTNNQTQAPQGASNQNQMQAPQGAPQQPTMQQRMAGITQALSLTDAQQQQIYPMLQQAQQKMQALAADSSTPIADRQVQADAVRKNLHMQIAAVLTPEQKQKLESLTNQRPSGPGTQPPSQPQR